MKIKEFNDIWSKFGAERSFRTLEWFPLNNIPGIAIPMWGPSGGLGYIDYMNAGAVTAVLDLNKVKKNLENLKNDEIFVIGSHPMCDYLWRFNPETASAGYSAKWKGPIAEIHCIIKRGDEDSPEPFLLIDCSNAGTIMMVRNQ